MTDHEDTPAVEPRNLRDYQKQAVVAVEETWDSGIERTSVILPTGAGKPLADTTIIPTLNRGMVPMGNLELGDTVVDPDTGGGVAVVAIAPQGVIPLVRITLSDGSWVDAGTGHLWAIVTKAGREIVTTADLEVGDTLPTADCHIPKGTRTITSIVEVKAGAATCIQVASETGLFCCTEDYIPTHNSTVMASLATRARAGGMKVVLMAHRGELLYQLKDAIMAVDPQGEEPGIVKAGCNETDRDIVIASVPTLARSAERVAELGERQVVLCDEAHHATAASYLTVMNRLGLSINPSMTSDDMRRLTEKDVTRHDGPPPTVACGFTATMTRSDKTKLGAVWSTVAFEKDLVWALDSNILIPPSGKTVQIPKLDALSGLRTVRGDYATKELDTVMRASLDSTVDAVLAHAADRSSLVFAATKDHANELADALTKAGLPAAAVVNDHSREEREISYAAFNAGTLKCLVTVNVLTEGADFPRCDCVVLARPTRSDVLFSQMVGRAVRRWINPETGEEKTDALVLDLTGVTRDMKLRRLTDLWPKASTVTVDTDGNEVVPPPPPAEKTPTPERTGRIDLETIDLLSTATEAASAVILRTDSGVTFIPGGMDSTVSYALWPPNAEDSDKVFVFQIPDKMSSPPVVATNDAGQPIYDTFDNALIHGGLHYANTTGYISRRAGWRKGSKPPTEGQLDFARRIGARVREGDSRAAVSDAIEKAKMERYVARHIGQFVRSTQGHDTTQSE